MSASQAPAAPGANCLGKYRLIAELGHGGMAEVFLAVVQGPAGFNKLVVIKQIRPQLAEDPEFLGMFLDEARLAARLSHPNVVQTNEVGHEGNRYFIAMEYLEGQPLNRVIHRALRGLALPPPSVPTSTPVPVPASVPSSIREVQTLPGSGSTPPSAGLSLAMHLKIISDALSGLHHAHELTDYDGTPLNVVHRDVTPHNVFVTYDGQVKVVDFGIAKALNSSAETRTGVLKGKVAYMAPEQAQGERVDRRADIFSMGVMLWEAATGKRLWKGVPDITILQRLMVGEIPTPRSVNPDVSERLEAIVMKAIAHRREDRYATALDLQADLDDFIDSLKERVTSRELGKLVAAAFEADRAKIKGIIDEQLRSQSSAVLSRSSIALTETAQSLPRIDMQSHPAIGTSQSERKALEGGSGRHESYRSGTSSSYTGYTGPSLTRSSAPPEQPSRKRRSGAIVAISLVVTAVGAIGLWMGIRGTPRPASPEGAKGAATAPTSAAATTATTATPAQVDISISATPAEAKLFLDDKPIDNPFKDRRASDTARHRLRVEASGYVTQVRELSLERAVDIELALVKDPSVAEKADKPSSPVRSNTGSPPPEDLLKRPGGKPKRTIDTNNPYPQ